MDPEPSELEQAPADAPASKVKKTAVVLIHGMGEQRPMETLWGFVEAAWTRDSSLTTPFSARVFAKPDAISGSFELRRVTTTFSATDTPRRFDFFEFYWAHLMTGNSIKGVLRWIASLVIRGPSSVPVGMRAIWAAGLALLLIAAVVAALVMLPEAWRPTWVDGWIWITVTVLAAAGGLFASAWLAPVAGDAARYFSPDPDNVAARQQIREAGVDFLGKVAATGEYDRIVVVGHSLGSAIGYDILNYAWGRLPKEVLRAAHARGSAAAAGLRELEDAGWALQHAKPEEIRRCRSRYRDAQRQYASTLASAGPNPVWLVSDFVTLGSPLSKAQVLVARSEAEFETLRQRRQLPTSPPYYETSNPPRFSYSVRGVRIPHHGAVFGPTIWTNLYFPNRLLIFGDLISGPLAELFGRGIRDVRLAIGGARFRHLDYWADAGRTPPHSWISNLQSALNLRRASECALWNEPDSKADPATAASEPAPAADTHEPSTL